MMMKEESLDDETKVLPLNQNTSEPLQQAA